MNKLDSNNSKANRFTRRELLKSFATLPFVGALAYGYYKKTKFDRLLNSNLVSELGLDVSSPIPEIVSVDGKQIRLGIIGAGGRGQHLLRGAGLAPPSWIDEVRLAASKNPTDDRYQSFLAQENLNVRLNGVCDIFDINAEKAIAAGNNVERKSSDQGTEKYCKAI